MIICNAVSLFSDAFPNYRIRAGQVSVPESSGVDRV